MLVIDDLPYSAIPNVITYAAVLENLNQLIQKDWKFFEVCHNVWSKSHNTRELLQSTTLFGTIKTLTVEFALGNYFTTYFKKG